MKKYLLFATLLASGAAHADWTPYITSRVYSVTIESGGASHTYYETRTLGGPVSTVASQFLSVPQVLQSSLNTYLAAQASAQGVRFLGGTLSGAINVALRPDTYGVTFINLHGMSYTSRMGYSGKQWGFISYDCVNTLTLANMSATAQYGSVDGVMQSDKIGLNATPSSSTSCDSNLSWIMPIVGDYIIDSVTDKIDAGIVSGINTSSATVKDALFFGRDQNYLTGLNKLIPRDKVLTLPDGRTFPIGQYVQDNMAYLIGNSQVTMKLDRGPLVQAVYGLNEPMYDSRTGDIAVFTVSTPAATFSVSLKETDTMTWRWVCSLRDPSRVCQMP